MAERVDKTSIIDLSLPTREKILKAWRNERSGAQLMGTWQRKRTHKLEIAQDLGPSP